MPPEIMAHPVIHPIVPHPLDKRVEKKEAIVQIIPTMIEVMIIVKSSSMGLNTQVRIAGNNPNE